MRDCLCRRWTCEEGNGGPKTVEVRRPSLMARTRQRRANDEKYVDSMNGDGYDI